MSRWPSARLSDLCESIDYGYTAAAQEKPVGPKFLRITDIRKGALDWNQVPFVDADEDVLRKYKLHVGDIVIARTGAFTGANAYITEVPEGGAVFASYLIRLATNANLNSRYTYYFLQSNWYKGYIAGSIGGSAQPNANAKVLTGVEIPLPPLPEQRAIAHILGTLDDKIELNRRMNQTLEEMARAIFESWFVDFDPVRAKAEGKKPAGIDEATAALFPDAFEDSELGEIPIGWKTTRIGDIATFENGDRGKNYPKTKDYIEHGIPFINAGHLEHGRVNLDAAYRISEATFERLRSGKIQGDDLLYCLRGSPGRVARTKNIGSGAIASSLVIIREASWAPITFLYYLLSGSIGRQLVVELDNGSAQPNISVRSLQNYPVLFPPSALIEIFDDLVQAFWNKADLITGELTTLIKTRDTLLPILLSGRISVEDFEKAAE